MQLAFIQNFVVSKMLEIMLSHAII